MAVASARSGHRTLIISTDPAASLGDVFDVRLSSRPRRIPLAQGVLHGLEIDAPRVLARWLASRRPGFERIALRGTWLDRDDVSALLSLSLPGVDELAALLEMHRLAIDGRYDRIVVDTAPTGHTLRMLMAPESLRAIARVFDLMQSKHRVVVEALRGAWTADVDDVLIEEIDRTGEALNALLRDPGAMHVTWVTLPESMSVEETVDAATALGAAGIPLREIVINQLTPAPPQACGWCDRRRHVERQALAGLRQHLPRVPAIGISSRAEEPRGVRALASVGREIRTRQRAVSGRTSPGGLWRAAGPVPRAWSALPLIAGPETRFILFGGKGGVGKTTCAAAAAVAIASEARDRRITLLSTDPAHSLADAFAVPVTDVPAPPWRRTPKLLVQEVDAPARFRAVRDRYAAAADALFDRLTSNRSGSVRVDVGQDRRVMRSLIDLAPPGIDELAAIIDVIDTLQSDPSHLLIMDSAPSGHALRLLEMPAVVQDWVKALMSILLKYQPVAGVGDLGAVLLRLSRGLGYLRALLTDSARTSFIVVTRAAALPGAETGRLMRRLRRLRIHVPLVIINAVGRGTCARCRRAGRIQHAAIGQLGRQLPNRVPITIAPAELPPPSGAAALLRWQRTWRPHTKRPAPAAISS